MGAKRASATGRTGQKGQQERRVAAVRPDEGRKLLTVPEAAYELHISPRTCWKKVWEKNESKRLETVWIGSRRFVPVWAVTNYIERLAA